jgi:putative Mg2+ transporter-C (MgtC) family protein
MTLADIILRLGAAAIVGGAIGLNRDLHHKPSGLRTLSLVAVGAALATLTVSQAPGDAAAASRVLQGLITGVGFLGAGVIVHNAQSSKVHGLTTAATIWVTAVLGAACGTGDWPVVAVTVAIVSAILSVGGRIEKAVHATFDTGKPPPGPSESGNAPRPTD